MAVFKLTNDDIFISYCRSDATTYTDGLANELTKKGFSCFTDALGTDANKDLPPTLISKLKGCRMLVIVGSADAAKSGPVAREVELFIEARGSSAIIPIDINGNTDDAVWKDFITGIRRERESAEALLSGNPSPAVVSRVEKAFAYRKSKESLKVYTRTAIIVLALLIVAISAAGFTAYQQTKIAANAAKDASDKTLLATKASALAKAQTELARQAGQKASLMADSALKMSQKKDAAEAEFRLASQRAKEATAKAERQQRIATSFQYANEAQSILSNPDSITNSVAKALQSMEMSTNEGVHSLVSDAALRASLTFFPDIKSKKNYKDHLKPFGTRFRFTATGEIFEEYAADSMRQYYRPGEQVPFFSSIFPEPFRDLFADVAISSNGKYIALSGGNGSAVRLCNTADKSFKDYRPRNNRKVFIQTIAISPDGKYLAANWSGNDAGDLDFIDVWNTEKDSLVEFFTGININGLSFSPGGDALVAGGRGFDIRGESSGKALIWDLSGLKDQTFEDDYFKNPYTQLQESEIGGVAAGPNYRIFATEQQHNITVWEMDVHQKYLPVCYIPLPTEHSSCVFVPEQNTIIVRSVDTGSDEIITTYSYKGYTAEDERLIPQVPDEESTDWKNRAMWDKETFPQSGNATLQAHWQHLSDFTNLFYLDNFQSEKIIFHTNDLQYKVTSGDSLHFWKNNRLLHSIALDSNRTVPDQFAFSGNGNTIAWVDNYATDEQKQVMLLNLKNGAYRLEDSFATQGTVSALAFVPGSTSLLVRDQAGLFIRDIAAKKETPLTYKGNPASGDVLALSPNGSFACLQYQGFNDELAKPDLNFYIWNLKTQQIAGVLEHAKSNEGGDRPFAWSPDEGSLLSSFGSQAGLWHRGASHISFTVDNASYVTAVAFSPSGKYFGIGTQNGLVRIFETASLQEVCQMDNDGKIEHIIFSSDDRYCSVTTDRKTMLDLNPDENQSIVTWQLSPAGLIGEAKQRLEKMSAYPVEVRK